MGHALDGCIARLDWTKTYLEAFERVLTTQHIHEDPADPFTGLDLDLDAGTLKVVMLRDFPVPLDIGIVLGDVVRMLHATLDNLAFALGSIDHKIPRDDRDIAFPVLTDANTWFDPKTFSKLRYIRPKDRTQIEMLQPFMRNAGLEPNKDALARIVRYSNTDKHRVIPAAASALLNSAIDRIDTERCHVEAVEVEKWVGLRKDAVVLRAAVTDIGDNPTVKMNGSLDWVPTIEDEPIQTFCGAAIAYVRAIVESFQPSFGTPALYPLPTP